MERDSFGGRLLQMKSTGTITIGLSTLFCASIMALSPLSGFE